MWTQVSKCVRIQQVGKATGITQLSMNLDHLSDLAPNEFFLSKILKAVYSAICFFFLILEIKYLGIIFFFVKYYDQLDTCISLCLASKVL